MKKSLKNRYTFSIIKYSIILVIIFLIFFLLIYFVYHKNSINKYNQLLLHNTKLNIEKSIIENKEIFQNYEINNSYDCFHKTNVMVSEGLKILYTNIVNYNLLEYLKNNKIDLKSIELKKIKGNYFLIMSKMINSEKIFICKILNINDKNVLIIDSLDDTEGKSQWLKYHELNKFLVYKRDKTEFYSHFLLYIFIVLIIGFCIIIFLIYMSQNDILKLIKIINNFIMQTKGVSERNYNIIDDDYRYDELNNLKKYFNEMIEEIRHREYQLLSSQARLKESQHLAQMGSWEYLINDNSFYLSDEARNILGYSYEDSVNFNDLKKSIQNKYRMRFQECVKLCISADLPFSLIQKIKCKNGKIIYIKNIGKKVVDSDNQVKIAGTIQDLDEIISVRNQLGKMQNFLNNIIESMPSGLFVIDKNNNIVLANTEFKNIFGIDFIDDKTFSSLFQTEKEMMKSISLVRNNNKAINLPRYKFNVFIKKYFDIIIIPLDAEKLGDVVIRIDDITQQERMRNELFQNQKMETIGSLAGGIAHDFNNILTGIVTTVSALKFMMEEDDIIIEDFKEYIDLIDKSGDRASNLVNQLLTLSKRNKLVFSSVCLNSIIEEVLSLCKKSFDKEIEFEINIPEYDCIINGDANQIHQILLNLLVNSNHALTIMDKQDVIKNKKIQVDLKSKGENYEVSINDNGVGINNEFLNKIFEPFFTTKDKEHGTGLGLSMVYNIVKQHGGNIDVISNKEIGTTFVLLFPKSKNKVIERTIDKKIINKIQSSDINLLMIDDEKHVLRLMSDIVKKLELNINLKSDAIEGLEFYKNNFETIDIVILDMSMPKMSGNEVFDEIRKIDKKQRVIMASGFELDNRMKKIIDQKNVLFLQKPFKINQVIDILNKSYYM